MSESMTPGLDAVIEMVHNLNVRIDGLSNRVEQIEENLTQLRDAIYAIKADDPTVNPTA